MCLEAKNPHKQLADRRQYLENLGAELKDAMRQKLLFEKYRLQLAAERLEGKSPLRKLESGFSYITDENDRNIKSVSGVKREDRVHIRVSDGTILAQVLEVLEESFQLYGKGIEMIKQLKEKLDATEKKIIVLEEE